MSKAPAVIQFRGDRQEAYLKTEGRTIQRINQMRTKDGTVPILNTGGHLIYDTQRWGARFRCSCGLPAVIVGSGVYRKFSSSYLGNEVMMCQGIASDGKHGDGSSG